MSFLRKISFLISIFFCVLECERLEKKGEAFKREVFADLMSFFSCFCFLQEADVMMGMNFPFSFLWIICVREVFLLDEVAVCEGGKTVEENISIP